MLSINYVPPVRDEGGHIVIFLDPISFRVCVGMFTILLELVGGILSDLQGYISGTCLRGALI